MYFPTWILHSNKWLKILIFKEITTELEREVTENLCEVPNKWWEALGRLMERR